MGAQKRQGRREIALQAADVIEEQLRRLAVPAGKDVLAGFGIQHRLMDMHGRARLVLMGLGHEGCIHVVLQGRLAHGALEQEHLVGKLQRIAVIEIDLELGRAAFMGQRIDIQFLGFAVVVDILDDRIEIIGGVDAIGLAAGFLAARAADGGFKRIIGIEVLLDQIEFEFGRHDRAPALVLVKPQHALQHMARRNLDRLVIEMEGIADHLGGRLGVPGHHADGFGVRLHVDVDGAVAHRLGFRDVAAIDGQRKDFLGNAQAARRCALAGISWAAGSCRAPCPTCRPPGIRLR